MLQRLVQSWTRIAALHKRGNNAQCRNSAGYRSRIKTAHRRGNGMTNVVNVTAMNVLLNRQRQGPMQALAKALGKFFALMCLPVALMAQPIISWDQLSDQQQEVLAPLQENWDSLPPQRQQNLLRGAQRWQNLSSEEQSQASQRFQDWAQRSPEQKAQIRDRFERFRELDPARQRALRERFRDFQNMDENRRTRLREQFQNRGPGGRPPGRFPGDNQPPPRRMPPPPPPGR